MVMDLYGLLLSILIPFPGATSSWRPANFQTTSCAGGSPKNEKKRKLKINIMFKSTLFDLQFQRKSWLKIGSKLFA